MSPRKPQATVQIFSQEKTTSKDLFLCAYVFWRHKGVAFGIAVKNQKWNENKASFLRLRSVIENFLNMNGLRLKTIQDISGVLKRLGLKW